MKDPVVVVELLIGTDAVKFIYQVLDPACLRRICDEFFIFVEDGEEGGQKVWLLILRRLSS